MRCVVLPLLAASVALGADPPKRPNIVFIFTDDHAYDAVGFMGNAQVKTPALDALAASGTVFTHAYNMGGYSPAVCVSSRMMLNSGRTLWRAGALHNKAEQERKAGRWWSEQPRMRARWRLGSACSRSS